MQLASKGELVAIETELYSFVIWSRDVTDSQERLARTLKARGKKPEASALLLSPPIVCKGADTPFEKITLENVIFFENKLYEFEFFFNESFVKNVDGFMPRIEHRLRSIEEAFHYTKRTCSLRGVINTGNDVGWLRLALVIPLENGEEKVSISMQVLPTKMDMESDLKAMTNNIEKEFPLWMFSFVERTQQAARSLKRPHRSFLLLWLAQFEALFDELETGVKQIVNSPHNRLTTFSRSIRPDQVKGRLNPKLEEKIGQLKGDFNDVGRIEVTKKKLSVDTPENRFVKFVINSSSMKLAKIHTRLIGPTPSLGSTRISTSYLTRLESREKSMRMFSRAPLFSEVGKYSGLHAESLVLQQKTGYAKVYKSWQQLKHFLDLLEGDKGVSIRPVSELYEIWCFLEIRRLILELGFIELKKNRKPRLTTTEFEAELKDGMAGAFRFAREDGLSLRLAHEPIFGKNGREIKSWTATQKPDIFLEASYSDGNKIVWIFDAKYRIQNNDSSNGNLDLAPEDAVNQMHRYRDALIRMHSSTGDMTKQKSRPVFGAFALYPGYSDQFKITNPYAEEINEVGIGAFSMLPSDNGSGSYWLSSFLKSKFTKNPYEGEFPDTDRHYVEEAPRISYSGTTVTRHKDLTILFTGNVHGRTPDYVALIENNLLEHYHTQLNATSRQNIEMHIVREVRFLGVALEYEPGCQKIGALYPVNSVKLVERCNIRPDIAGVLEPSNSKKPYWLFELDKAILLPNQLRIATPDHFTITFKSFSELYSDKDFTKLEERYRGLVNP